jgi:hypothetical protein
MPAVNIELPVIDVSDTGGLIEAELRRSFDRNRGPWLRAGIFRESSESNTLYITTHHIASDGWSDAVIFSELHALYAAFSSGKPSPLPPLPIQFRDFAGWQHEKGNARNRMRHAPYWQQQLADAPALQEIATDNPRSDIPSLVGRTRHAGR